MLPAAKPTLSTPRSTARAAAWAMMSGERSRPVTLPGATSSAKSQVMLPGPQPTSRTEVPGVRCGITNAAEFSAVREAWARTTDSWWPCVYTSSGCCALIMERYPPAPGKGWTPNCGSAGARRQAVFCGWPSVLPLPAPGILRMNGGVEDQQTANRRQRQRRRQRTGPVPGHRNLCRGDPGLGCPGAPRHRSQGGRPGVAPGLGRPAGVLHSGCLQLRRNEPPAARRRRDRPLRQACLWAPRLGGGRVPLLLFDPLRRPGNGRDRRQLHRPRRRRRPGHRGPRGGSDPAGRLREQRRRHQGFQPHATGAHGAAGGTARARRRARGAARQRRRISSPSPRTATGRSAVPRACCSSASPAGKPSPTWPGSSGTPGAISGGPRGSR